MVGEEGLAASRRTEDELVAVRDDAPSHRLVADVHMHGDTVPAVGQADAERAGRAAVVRLFSKQADGLLQKGVEALLSGKIADIARNARPVEHRGG